MEKLTIYEIVRVIDVLRNQGTTECDKISEKIIRGIKGARKKPHKKQRKAKGAE